MVLSVTCSLRDSDRSAWVASCVRRVLSSAARRMGPFAPRRSGKPSGVFWSTSRSIAPKKRSAGAKDCAATKAA